MNTPVVLVHGLTGSTGWWDATRAALEPHHDVRVVTLPGFAGPRRSRQSFVVAHAAEWLLGWLDGEGLGRVTLVGHSMGGMIALLAAARAPERVERLVLIAPAGIFESASRRSYVLPVLRAVSTVSPRTLPVLGRDLIRAGPLRLWRVASELLASDVRPAFRAVRSPSLVIWGGRDRLLPPALGEVFRSEMQNSRLLVLPKAAHVPMLDAPNEVNQALLRFLQEGSDQCS